MTPAELEAVGLRDDDEKLLDWLWYHGEADDAKLYWIARGLEWSERRAESALRRLKRRKMIFFHKGERAWALTCLGSEACDLVASEAHHATRIAGELERIDHADS